MSLFEPLWQPAATTAATAATTAATIPFTPSGGLTEPTVEGALIELDTKKLAIADIDDAPVDGVVNAPISSNWAYDHAASATAHGISSFGATLVDDTDVSTARTTLDLTHAYYLAAIALGALI